MDPYYLSGGGPVRILFNQGDMDLRGVRTISIGRDWVQNAAVLNLQVNRWCKFQTNFRSFCIDVTVWSGVGRWWGTK